MSYHKEMGDIFSEGMALRDYFAAKALAANILKYNGDPNNDIDLIAAWSYEAADAMIFARDNSDE